MRPVIDGIDLLRDMADDLLGLDPPQFLAIERMTRVCSIAMRMRCLGMSALAISGIAVSAWAEGPDLRSGTSIMMYLQNLQGPFVDRGLAVQIGRAVVSAKYPLAVLSGDAPQVSDQGDTWLVTLSVVRWTEAAQLFRDVKSIPISIRKKDAAIMDIFPHGVGRDETPDAVRKKMATDPVCKGCHLRVEQP